VSGNLDPVRRSLVVRCSAERAFRVFTEEMGTWWPLDQFARSLEEAPPGVRATGVLVESRAGGSVMEKLSEGGHLSWGQVLVWDPPRRLVLAWKPNPSERPPTELEITFRPEGTGTRVDLEHRGWERLGEIAAESRDGYSGGWVMVFDRCFGKAAERAAA